MDEHAHAVALMTWARTQVKRYPDIGLLYAIPNGGLRHRRTAARLKAEGAKAGVPDYHLPVPRAGRLGLWVELKVPGGNGRRRGSLRVEQRAWLDALRAVGHRAVVAYGWEQAASQITQYLEGLE